MWGFHLKRGDAIVYNLTGARVNHPFHQPVPDWALAMDGMEIDKILATLKPDDEAKTDLLTACRLEQARWNRSRHKLHGDTCVASLWLKP